MSELNISSNNANHVFLDKLENVLETTFPRLDFANQDKLSSFLQEQIQTQVRQFVIDHPEIIDYIDHLLYPTQEPNPFFQGSLMTDIYIIMQELIRLNAKLRKEESELALASLQTRYETSIESAEVKKKLAMNQAYQSLVGAVQNAAEVVHNSVSILETSAIDIKAKAEYDQDVKDIKTQVETKKNELKQAIAEQEGAEDLTDDAFKAKLEDPDYFKDPDLPDNVKKAHTEFKDAEKNLENMTKKPQNIINNKREEMHQIIRSKQQVMTNITEGLKNSAVAGLQMSRAGAEEVQAQIDAITQITSDYMQGQQSDAQRARDVMDQIRRSLEQLQQNINSSFSSRA